MRKLKKIVTLALNKNNRLYVHLLFWMVYYLYRVQLYIDIYPYTPIVQFLEMLIILPVVYFNFYVLLPKFLKPKRTLEYAFLLLLSILFSTVLLTETIRFMMIVGIYTPNYETLYSAWKTATLSTRITGIVLTTSAIKILKDAYISQQINQRLEKDILENELKYLKAQINPHFFFNTLNNLYSLVQQKSAYAPEMVLKLSELMHYMLYETNQNFVPLAKEVETLFNYIELEKIRFGDELNIVVESNGTFENQYIAPMLLIPIIENSFKHGPNGSLASNWIKIRLEVNEDQFQYIVENSAEQSDKPESGGIGLNNIRRRLELIYKDRFELKTARKPDSFSTRLSIDLSKATKYQK